MDVVVAGAVVVDGWPCLGWAMVMAVKSRRMQVRKSIVVLGGLMITRQVDSDLGSSDRLYILLLELGSYEFCQHINMIGN